MPNVKRLVSTLTRRVKEALCSEIPLNYCSVVKLGVAVF
jgi:hypothetical protein